MFIQPSEKLNQMPWKLYEQSFWDLAELKELSTWKILFFFLKEAHALNYVLSNFASGKFLGDFRVWSRVRRDFVIGIIWDDGVLCQWAVLRVLW